MSGPLTAWYTNGHVLGRLIYRKLDWSAHCRGVAYEVDCERWKGVDQLSRCADLEWNVSFAWFCSTYPVMDFDCAEAKERYLHIVCFLQAKGGNDQSIFIAQPEQLVTFLTLDILRSLLAT